MPDDGLSKRLVTRSEIAELAALFDRFEFALDLTPASAFSRFAVGSNQFAAPISKRTSCEPFLQNRRHQTHLSRHEHRARDRRARRWTVRQCGWSFRAGVASRV